MINWLKWSGPAGVVSGLVIATGLVYFSAPTQTPFWETSVKIGNYCSGTLIEDPKTSDGIQTTVLTAKHCINTEQKVGSVLDVYVQTGGTETQPVKTLIKMKIVSISSTSDLALLQAVTEDPKLDLPSVSVAQNDYGFGTEVWSVSYPYDKPRSLVSGFLGYIVNIAGFSVSKSNDWQMATLEARPGSSGSGMYVKEGNSYKLYGTLTWGDMRAPYITFYTPTKEIRDFLAGYGK